MPELPEVEALAIFLQMRASGHSVTRAEAASFAVLKTFDPPLSALTGRSITEVTRHGKFLDLTAADADGELHLVFHLARAGWLRWREDMPDKLVKPGKSPLAFRLVFDDGAGFDLTEQGTQKRLAVYLVKNAADVPGVASLGPEPLAGDFDVAALAAILNGRRTQIKGVLRDQHIIAGIGNAYSDEVLHAAKMSPFKLASSFTPDEVATLHSAIVTTLREAVERSAGLAAADLKGEKKTGLRVHGKTGQPCPVCGDVIREVSFADSSLQYCATCQTGGKPLADRRMSRLLKLQFAFSSTVRTYSYWTAGVWSLLRVRRGRTSATARGRGNISPSFTAKRSTVHGGDNVAMSGAAADGLSPANQVNIRRRHARGDTGLELDLRESRGHQFTTVRALRLLPWHATLVRQLGLGQHLRAVRVGKAGEIDLQRNARFRHGKSGLGAECGDHIRLSGLVKLAPHSGRLAVPAARHRGGQQVADAWCGPSRRRCHA